jgi:hypothetical protein
MDKSTIEYVGPHVGSTSSMVDFQKRWTRDRHARDRWMCNTFLKLDTNTLIN